VKNICFADFLKKFEKRINWNFSVATRLYAPLAAASVAVLPFD